MSDDLLVRVDANTTGYEAAIARAERQTKSFEYALRRAAVAQKEQEAALLKQKAALEATGRTLGVIGAVAAAAFVGAVKSAADFEAKIAQINSLLPETQKAMVPALAAATKGFADLGISATEAADAEIELVKAGVSAKDILGGALQGTLVLSAAGMIDVGQATQIAASAMTQFGLSGADIPHVADLLAAAADKSLGGVSDLGFGLKQAGTTAAQFGFSIEDTTGLLAEFAAAGLVGEQGGTTLKQMFLQLAAPTAKAQELMDQYNLSLYNANGTTKNGAELAGMLAEGFKGVTPEVKNAALATIFGSRAIQGANILLADGAKKAGDWAKAVQDDGFAVDQARGKMDSLNGDLEKLSATFSNFVIELGEGGQGPSRVFVQSLTGLLNVMTDLPAPVKFAMSSLLALIATVGLGSYALIKLKGAFTATKTNMTDLGMGFSDMSKKMMLIRGGAAVAGAGLIALGQSGVIASDGLSDAATALGAAAMGFAVGGPWGAAIGGGIALLTSMGNEQSLTASSVESLTSTIDQQTGALTANSREMIAHDIATNGLLKLAQAAGASLEDTTLAAMGNADAYDRVTGSLDGNNLVAQEFIRNLDAQVASVDASKEAAMALAKAQRDSSVTGEQGADAIAGMGDAASASSDAVNELTSAMDELNSAALKNRGSFRDWKSSILDARDALKENGKTLNANTREGLANADALDNMANIAIAHRQAMVEDGVGIKQQTAYMESARETLFNTARQFGMTKAEARDYINTVLQIPTKAQTQVILNGIGAANAALTGLKIGLDGLPSSKTINIRTNTTNTILDRHLTSNHAAGGYISGPGTGTSDSIPAMLSNGEFVVKASATRKHLGLLHAINSQGFADGGHVGGLSMSELLRMIGRSPGTATVGHVNDLNRDRLRELRDVTQAEHRLHAARERVKNTAKALAKAENNEHTSAERLRLLRHQAADATRDADHAEASLTRERDQATEAADKQKEAQQRLLEQSKTWAATVLDLGAAFGGEGTSNTAQGLLAKLRSSTHSGREFEHDLATLRRRHLDPAILRQIRDEGPTAGGLALADSLANASNSQLRNIRREQNALERVSGQVGTVGVGGRHQHHSGGHNGKTGVVQINGNVTVPNIEKLSSLITKQVNKALMIARQP